MDILKKDANLSDVDDSLKNGRPYRVGIYAVPGFALMSYACCVEPFRAANILSRETLYELVHFSKTASSESSVGAFVQPDHGLSSGVNLDILFVIAGGDPIGFSDPLFFKWLRQLAYRNVVIAGVSGGPVLLAKSGLMEGHRMTVHWEHAEGLSEILPNLLLEKKRFVIDRDRMTCGGGMAALDLTHAIINKHHGAEFARLVSDWFLHTDIRAPSDPQRGGLVERLGLTSAPILAAVAAMENHIADPLTLEQLADQSGVTSRQLNRLFQDKIGNTTMGFYRNLRLDVGFQLLGNSPLSVTEIGLATGFAGSAHFSSAFSKCYGYPPSRLRKKNPPKPLD